MAASNCAGRARGPSRGLCSAQRERVPFRTASFGSYVASLNIPTTHAGASVGLLQGAAAHCTAPAPRLAPRRAVALAEAPPAVSSVIEDVRAAHKEIRDRVVQAHTKGGVLYVASGAQILRNGSDVFHKFRADSNFAYLTGVAEPDCGCLIDSETGRYTLVVPKLPPDAAFWVGALPGPEELAYTHGADDVIYATDLGALLSERYVGAEVHCLPEQRAALAATTVGSGSNTISNAVSDRHMQPLLHRCRAFKTGSEVEALRRANQVSGAAHMEMWRYSKRAMAAGTGCYEYQLEAAFVGASLAGGLPQLGYPCIVGAGNNAAILHYERNNCQVRPDDLVLVDAGAEHRCYTADISRTFPASGRYSAAQRDVYNATLDVQERALSLIAPGAVWSDVDAAARVLLLERLAEMGLVRGSTESLLEAKVDRVFCPHGLSHFLGLDVHDVSEDGPVPKTLAPGHVITCEPGLYFMDTLLHRAKTNLKQTKLIKWDRVERFRGLGGVRIEDDVAVTQSGSDNLTAPFVPKVAADIEAFMAAV